MGIIKAAINAVGGGLADSWLEVIEPSPMGDNTLICPGQLVSQNGKSQNKKGSEACCRGKEKRRNCGNMPNYCRRGG